MPIPASVKRGTPPFIFPKRMVATGLSMLQLKVLRSILRVLNFVLQAIHEPHSAATGFVQGRSIVDNAQAHAGKHYVYNLDLKDFFHSFDRNRVKLGFMKKPFNLRKEKSKEELAFFLSCLCTHPFEVDSED